MRSFSFHPGVSNHPTIPTTISTTILPTISSQPFPSNRSLHRSLLGSHYGAWLRQPDAQTLHGEFMRWLRHGCGLAKFFVQLATCPAPWRPSIARGSATSNRQQPPATATINCHHQPPPSINCCGNLCSFSCASHELLRFSLAGEMFLHNALPGGRNSTKVLVQV